MARRLTRQTPTPRDGETLHEALLRTDPHALILGGVHYYIYWDQLPVGGSFFIPTVVTLPTARDALRSLASVWGYQVVVHRRVEYGRLGVRTWRLG
jgi:hypothetical protein